MASHRCSQFVISAQVIIASYDSIYFAIYRR